MLALVTGACLAHVTSVPSAAPATARAASASAPPSEAAPVAEAIAQPSPQPGRDAPTEGAPEPPGPAPWTGLGEDYRNGKIITGSTPHRLILFSFDDGPDRRTTPLLLDRLDAEGIKALFFLVAERLGDGTPRLRQQSSIAQEIVRRGHLVGNHTVNHVQLPLLDTEAAMAEVLGAQRAFEETFGARPWLIRPPFGAHSQRIDQNLAARDYTIVLWNLGAGDHQVRSAQEVFDVWLKVMQRREREEGDRGGIILLHDTYAWSVDAFQRIVAHLRARNCELLEQGEELYDFVDDLSFFFEAREDASAEATAEPAMLAPGVLAERQARLRELTAQHCRSIPTL